MGEHPERESNFGSGPLRSEVKLQSKLNVARVASASEPSEVDGANGQGRVAKTTQGIVRPIEYVKKVRLEHQAHIFSRQSEALTQ